MTESFQFVRRWAKGLVHNSIIVLNSQSLIQEK